MRIREGDARGYKAGSGRLRAADCRDARALAGKGLSDSPARARKFLASLPPRCRDSSRDFVAAERACPAATTPQTLRRPHVGRLRPSRQDVAAASCAGLARRRPWASPGLAGVHASSRSASPLERAGRPVALWQSDGRAARQEGGGRAGRRRQGRWPSLRVKLGPRGVQQRHNPAVTAPPARPGSDRALGTPKSARRGLGPGVALAGPHPTRCPTRILRQGGTRAATA